MARYPVVIAATLFVALLGGQPWAVSGAPEQTDTEYRESVRVDIVQMEFTAWPRSGDAGECEGLTTDEVQLTVGGRARDVYALDRLGDLLPGIDEAGQIEAPAGTAAGSPLTMVLFFDLWHLNLFHQEWRCPMTRPLAFERARAMVRKSFRSGDRLLLVTFAGWPEVHYGWIREQDEALAALDRLEVSPSLRVANLDHSHDHALIDGIKSLFLALGRYPGRKEVLYLADDFRFDDLGARMREIGARAQSNGVSLHTVDLLATCRTEAGPPCTRSKGGLGCTEFRQPLGVASLATHGGGRVFGTDDVAAIVSEIREMQECRYLVSFRIRPGEGGKRRDPQVNIRLTRKGLQLFAPTSFQLPGHAPKERDEKDALFLLPQFGQGVSAEIGLWPLRPEEKGKRWTALMLLRVERTAGEEWPESVDEVLVEAVASRGGKIYGQFRRIVRGEDLDRLRDGGQVPLMVFPLTGVRPGETTVAARAWTANGLVQANVRASLLVPKPPLPGEAHPWFLIDSLARAGEDLTLLPALDGVLEYGQVGMILGFGCASTAAGLPGKGRIASFDGKRTRPVPIRWLDGQPSDNAGSCGWLVGRIEPPVDPGLWHFEPPATFATDDGTPRLEFRVATVPD